MPVRVKHRALSLRKNEDLDKEWSELKRYLAGLLIAFQLPVKLTVLDAHRSRKLIFRGQNQAYSGPLPSIESFDRQDVDLSRLRAVLSQGGYINPAEFSSWITLSARSSDVSIQGALSLQPSPTKQAQFISFGINPAYPQGDSDVLFNEINRIFLASNFGTEEASVESNDRLENFGLMTSDIGETKKQNPRAKGVNKWPMFYIRITLYENNLTAGSKEDPLRSGVSAQRLIDIISAMLNQFLEQHNLSSQYRPRMKRSWDSSTSQPSERGTIQPQRKGNENSPTHDTGERIDSTDRNVKKLLQFKDFGSWSRVKSGKKEAYGDLCSGLPRGLDVSSQDNGARITRPSSVSSAPVVMQPGTPPGGSNCCSCSPESTRQIPLGDQQALTAEVVPWTNPVTKEVVLINQRTGQTLPPVDGKFRSGNLSCLLPRSSLAHRVRDTNRTSSEPASSKPTPWLDSFMKTWENPVFRQPECSIRSMKPDILGNGDWHPTMGKCLRDIYSEGLYSDALDGRFTQFEGRLGKEELREAKVIAQVDHKFILIKMNSKPRGSEDTEEILVLVDQHAADERYRVEQLFESLCGPSPSHEVETTACTDSVPFPISFQEAELFEARSGYFASWGCQFDIVRNNNKGACSVVVTKLPSLIAERCRTEPKLSIDMLRSELWSRADNSETSSSTLPYRRDESSGFRSASTGPANDNGPLAPHFWLHRIIDCPKKIVELLNSRACRSAIMFNDILDLEECSDLISRVSGCVFPFQCAHGRPSMVPVMNLGPARPLSVSHSENVFNFSHAKIKQKGSTSDLDFVGAFNAWQRQAP